MEDSIIYLDLLKEELTENQISTVLREFFLNLQNCVEEVIEGVLEKDFEKIRENLKTIQIISTTMYAPFIAEFALLCESYAEIGKESCLKESLVLMHKQITLVKKECYANM